MPVMNAPFSLSIIGSPSALIAEIQARADALSKQQQKSQEASDFGLIVGGVLSILQANVDADRNWVMAVDIAITATVDAGTKQKTYGRCSVNIRPLGVLVG